MSNQSPETAVVAPGQTLANPITGERFAFTHTAASTGGELLAFDLALRPGGAVPIAHVHPIQRRLPGANTRLVTLRPSTERS